MQTGSAVVAGAGMAVCTRVRYGQTLGNCSIVAPSHEVGGVCLQCQYPLVRHCQMQKRMMSYRGPGNSGGTLGIDNEELLGPSHVMYRVAEIQVRVPGDCLQVDLLQDFP